MGTANGSGGNKSRDYPVGKGKPDPKKWNRKPGESGNSNGRPKGSKNLKTIVKASARRTITVTKGGRKRKLTVLELGMLNLERDVAQGNRNAFRDYFAILERHPRSERDQTLHGRAYRSGSNPSRLPGRPHKADEKQRQKDMNMSLGHRLLEAAIRTDPMCFLWMVFSTPSIRQRITSRIGTTRPSLRSLGR